MTKIKLKKISSQLKQFKEESLTLASVIYPANLKYEELENFYQGLEEIAKEQSISFILYDIRWPKNRLPQQS